MDMEDVSFAELNPNAVQRIRELEDELRALTKHDILLLAYEKSDAEASLQS